MKKILLSLSIAFAMLFVFNAQSVKAQSGCDPNDPSGRYVVTYFGTDWNGNYFCVIGSYYDDRTSYGPSVCEDILEYIAYDNYENVYWECFIDEDGNITTYDYSIYPPFSLPRED